MHSYRQRIQNIFFNNNKLLLKATSLISCILLFIIYQIPFAVRVFASYEIFIQKSVNFNLRISFYRGFKNEMTYRPSKVIWWKISKWAVNLFWCLSHLYRYHQIQEPVRKLLTVFPVSHFPVLLITKYFTLDVKGFLDAPLHTIYHICKSSQLTILNGFQYKMSRFIQF